MAGADNIYFGTADSNIDPKARLVIPIQYRKVIEANSPDCKNVVWTMTEKREDVPYLLCIDDAAREKYDAHIDNKELTKHCLDEQGRIVLDPLSQVQAQIKAKDKVKFVALYTGEAFEIWNAENFDDFTVDKRSLEQRLIDKSPPDKPAKSAS